MLNTEIELRNLQIVVSVLKDELVNITLEIKGAFSAGLSEKKRNKLYRKLRRAHENLQAAKEAERILIEDPTHHRSEIADAISASKYEEKEQRDEYRDRIFDFMKFRLDAIDNKIPSFYLSLIHTLVIELRAIRDAVDPFKGYKYPDKLKKLVTFKSYGI